MFGGAFFFQGQIGRFAFFLNGIVTVPAVMIAALVTALMPLKPAGMIATVIALCLGFGWFTLSLSVRRIRDIGWDPFVVLVGAIAVNLGDIVLARLVPSLSTDGFNTGIGALTNLLLSLVLRRWPGTADMSSIHP